MKAKKEYIILTAGLFFLLKVFINFREFIADVFDMFASYASYKVTFLIPFILDILFAVFLLIGKRKLFLIPVGVKLLLDIPWIIRHTLEFGFDFVDLLDSLPYCILFAFIIISCTEKRKILKYMWFIPSVLLFVPLIDIFDHYFPMVSIINVAAIGLTGYWLTVEEGFEEAVIVNGYCDMRKHVLLLILTFGIWELIWVYRMNEYFNSIENFKKSSPKKELLLYIFVPFYSVYWHYQSGKKIDILAENNGIKSDVSIFCLVLSASKYLHSLLGIASPIIIQNQLNKFSKKPTLSEDGEWIEE